MELTIIQLIILGSITILNLIIFLIVKIINTKQDKRSNKKGNTEEDYFCAGDDDIMPLVSEEDLNVNDEYDVGEEDEEDKPRKKRKIAFIGKRQPGKRKIIKHIKKKKGGKK